MSLDTKGQQNSQNWWSYKSVQKFKKNSQAKVANIGMGITQFLTINLRTSYFQHFGECLLCTYLHIPGGRPSKLFVLQMSSGHDDGFCRCAQISLPIWLPPKRKDQFPFSSKKSDSIPYLEMELFTPQLSHRALSVLSLCINDWSSTAVTSVEVFSPLPDCKNLENNIYVWFRSESSNAYPVTNSL